MPQDEKCQLESRRSFWERHEFPHVYALLMGLSLLAALGTWVLPAGEFNRVLDEAVGREVVLPGTFHAVASSPIGPFQVFVSMMKGFTNAADVIAFVFFAYTSWFVVLRTGALQAAVGALLRAFGPTQQRYIMPLFLFVFGFAASVFGMFEETYGFLPLFVGMAIAMGYDAIVGAATIAVGIGMGYSAACMNPFTVILAQKFANLPLLSGFWFRIAASLVMLGAAAWWIMRYAARVKADPTQSYMYGQDMGELRMDHDELVALPFTPRAKAVCLICAASIIVLIWGITQKGWYFNEMGGLFLVMGVLGGLVGKLGINGTAKAFADGFTDIAFGCLLIGFSRTILVILQEGRIIDTIAGGLAHPLSFLPRWLAAEGMLATQNLINFFIPSGSGQAVVTMPIMAPMSDLLGISRQVAVLAFQLGDGLSNLMWPTASIPVICAIAHIPLGKWYRFFVPFFLLALLLQALAVAAAVAIGI